MMKKKKTREASYLDFLFLFLFPHHLFYWVTLSLFMKICSDEWANLVCSLLFFRSFFSLLISWRFTACSGWHARRLISLIGRCLNQFQRKNSELHIIEKNGTERTEGYLPVLFFPLPKKSFALSFWLKDISPL
jgi:hypothetical protein